MSWLKFNDSLNTLKGQLSNVTSAVQEAFAEGLVDDSEQNDKSIEEYKSFCEEQDKEIKALRQQIVDLQNKIDGRPSEPLSSNVVNTSETNTADQQNVPSTDDSWFWDPLERTTSSSASSNKEPDLDVRTSDLVTIPLFDNVSGDKHTEKIKKLSIENTVLNERIVQLQDTNRKLNENIEQLDREHGVIVEELLSHKRRIQDKCNLLEIDLSNSRKEADEMRIKFDVLSNSNQDLERNCKKLNEEYQEIKETYEKMSATNEDLQLKLNTLQNELTTISMVNRDLENKLNDCNKMDDFVKIEQVVDSNEKFLDLKREYDRVTNEHESLLKKIDELTGLQRSYQHLEEKYEQLLNDRSSIDQQKINSEMFDLKQETERINKLLLEREEVHNNKSSKLKLEIERLSAFEGENGTLKSEVMELKQTNQAWEEENCQLSNNYAALYKQMMEVQNSCDTLTQENIENHRNIKEQMERFYELQSEVDRLRIVEEDRNKIENDLRLIQKENLDLNERYRKISIDNSKSTQMSIDEFEKFKCEASENESKLVQENVVLQKQVIDLTSNLNNSKLSKNTFQLIDFRKEIDNYLNPPISDCSDDDYLSELSKRLSSTFQTCKLLEVQLYKSNEEIERLTFEKNNLKHEKETLRADLLHYEIEVAELMKNNSALLNEIDSYKAGKLETISEHNEDSILSLEKQLEDVANINKTLEDEYEDIQQELNNSNTEREKLISNIAECRVEIEKLKNENQNHCKQMEVMETEKSNLVFELNELKSEKDFNGQLECERKNYSMLEKEFNALNEEHSNLMNQFKSLQQTHLDYRSESERLIAEKESHILNYNHKVEELTQQLTDSQTGIRIISELKENVGKLQTENNELILMIQSKHDENVRYHEEIQRLSQLLISSANSECLNCTALQKNISTLQESISQLDKQIIELHDNDRTQRYLFEQQFENVTEEKRTLVKDVNRLREHLISVEDAHTQETIELQRIIEELKVKAAVAEDDALKSSTAYTSVNIRANQQSETLQTQNNLLAQQRKEFIEKLNTAEDRELKSQAALINLQCVLEQFQRDKDREIESQTSRIRAELNAEKQSVEHLRQEVATINEHLRQAKDGLLAATRLSDELEVCQEINESLREELQQTKDKLLANENVLKESTSGQVDRIEKNLIKNLIIGYVSSPNATDKTQILKLISAVLDFTQSESDKIGLNKQQTGWRNLLLNNNMPNRDNDFNNDGLAQAFVKFLERESQPQVNSKNTASALNVRQHSSNLSTSSAGLSLTDSRVEEHSNRGNEEGIAKSISKGQPMPILLSNAVLQNFEPPRNSSTILRDVLGDS